MYYYLPSFLVAVNYRNVITWAIAQQNLHGNSLNTFFLQTTGEFNVIIRCTLIISFKY